MFAFSSHNEQIKAIYGNFGFWAWLKYWYLETADYVTLQMLEKSIYDYDYKEYPNKIRAYNIVKERSKEETRNIFNIFGFGAPVEMEDIDESEIIQKEALARRTKTS